MQPEEAGALFAALDPIEPEALSGFWRGQAVATCHPVDELLRASSWAGKEFLSDGRVHPLVCSGPAGRLCLDPRRLPVRWALALRAGRLPGAAALFRRLMPFFATAAPRARLETVEDGAARTAAMLYDDLPITDVFRRAGPQSVMGRMDCPWLRRPAYFLLTRGA